LFGIEGEAFQYFVPDYPILSLSVQQRRAAVFATAFVDCPRGRLQRADADSEKLFGAAPCLPTQNDRLIPPHDCVLRAVASDEDLPGYRIREMAPSWHEKIAIIDIDYFTDPRYDVWQIDRTPAMR
jgi:hypothetical protein